MTNRSRLFPLAPTALLLANLLAGCGEGIVGDEDLLEGDESSREAMSAKTCTVDGSQVTVRTCVPTSGETGGVKNFACYAVGSVFGSQTIPTVLPVADITSPIDVDETLLGSRLRGLGLVASTKTLASNLATYNATLAAIRTKLGTAAGGACRSDSWTLGAVDNLLSPDPPKGLGFICAKMTSGTTLLDCSGSSSTTPVDSATCSPSSQTVNGVAIAFAKTGCGSFKFTLRNTSSSSSATYASAVTGVSLSPACKGTLGAGATQYCSVTGISGGGTRGLTYSGTVTSGGTTKSFSFAVSVRCD
jgi:hypothetical protein